MEPNFPPGNEEQLSVPDSLEVDLTFLLNNLGLSGVLNTEFDWKDALRCVRQWMRESYELSPGPDHHQKILARETFIEFLCGDKLADAIEEATQRLPSRVQARIVKAIQVLFTAEKGDKAQLLTNLDPLRWDIGSIKTYSDDERLFMISTLCSALYESRIALMQDLAPIDPRGKAFSRGLAKRIKQICESDMF